jgi:membrane-associated HD superfamily phosphohydrolase
MCMDNNTPRTITLIFGLITLIVAGAWLTDVMGWIILEPDIFEPILAILGGVTIVSGLLWARATSVPTGTLVSVQQIDSARPITLEQYLNGDATLAEQLRFFLQEIELDYRRSNDYQKARFETYSKVWKQLQKLRHTGDRLWKQASPSNIHEFEYQLTETDRFLNNRAIFFESKDYKQLKDLINHLKAYKDGKDRLFTLREFENNPIMAQQIANQINQNLGFKSRYEMLLDRIGISFRGRLSSWYGNNIRRMRKG